jgi:hypothetical protein
MSQPKTIEPAFDPILLGNIDVVWLSHNRHFDNVEHAGRSLLPGAGQVLATLEGLDAKLFPSLALCTVLQSCPCTLRHGEALLRVAKIGYTSVYCERTEGETALVKGRRDQAVFALIGQPADGRLTGTNPVAEFASR